MAASAVMARLDTSNWAVHAEPPRQWTGRQTGGPDGCSNARWTPGCPFGWGTADEAYGADTKFRLWLGSAELVHVVAVSKNAFVVTMDLRKIRATG